MCHECTRSGDTAVPNWFAAAPAADARFAFRANIIPPAACNSAHTCMIVHFSIPCFPGTCAQRDSRLRVQYPRPRSSGRQGHCRQVARMPSRTVLRTTRRSLTSPRPRTTHQRCAQAPDARNSSRRGSLAALWRPQPAARASRSAIMLDEYVARAAKCSEILPLSPIGSETPRRAIHLCPKRAARFAPCLSLSARTSSRITA